MKKLISTLLFLVMLTGIFSGCAGGGGEVKLTYLMYTGGGSLSGSIEVFKRMNEIIKREIGVEVSFKPYGYNEYGSKLQLAMQAGDNFDLCFTSPWSSPIDYMSAVSGGYLTDITTLLPQHAPELYNSLPQEIWDSTKVDGRIYAMINEQIFARQSCIMIATSLLNKYGFQAEDFEDPYDIKKLMAAMKSSGEEELSISAFVLTGMYEYAVSQYIGWEEVGGGIYMPGLVSMTDETAQVFNQYATSEYLEYALFMRSLIAEGYYTEDEMISQRYTTAKQRIRTVGTYKPGVEQITKLETNNQVDFTAVRFGTPRVTTAAVLATMTGVSSTSKNPEKAVEFINLLYKNEELYNMFAMGIEGREYKWNDARTEVEMISNQKYFPGASWALGSELKLYQQKGFPADWKQQTKELNAQSDKSVLYGFKFDPSSVKTEIANLTNVLTQYTTNFDRGLYSNVEQKITEFIAALNTAGMQTLIAEKQRQIDAFLATGN